VPRAMECGPLTESQRELVVQWSGLVPWAMQRYPHATRHLGPDWAEGVAVDALVRAAQRFDPARGVRFNTYASRAILSSLTRAVHRDGVVVRKSGGEYGHPPIRCGGTDALALTPDGRDPVGSELEALDEAAARKATLRRALRRLPPVWRKVVRLRVMGGLTLKATAALIGRTRERARQIQAKATARLRELLAGAEGEG